MPKPAPRTGFDAVWPANSLWIELGDETIFNSPVVFYAWDEVADAPMAKGAVTGRDGVQRADVAAIGDLIDAGARWREDFDVTVCAALKMFCTHPAKATSGNIWSGLLATTLNGGETPTEQGLPDLLPTFTAHFDRVCFSSAPVRGRERAGSHRQR